MHAVNPKSFIISESNIDFMGLRDFLDTLGAVDWDWADGGAKSDGELLAEVAGRTCYKSFGTELNKNLTRTRSDHVEYIGNILKTAHGSVLEHASTSVGFVDVSRIFTHELVRHRAGCAYSQESMRFVRLEDVGMYIPTCIAEDPDAVALFETAVIQSEAAYSAMVKKLITDDMPFAKKKEITSAIRRIAPSGHSTNIVVTANHRAWRHLFELRTAPGVEEEIGCVMGALGQMFARRYPAFYQDAHFITPDAQPWTTITFDNSKI
jgi:thymidylate synthase (FAD)